MSRISEIAAKRTLSREDIVFLLSLSDQADIEALRRAAYEETTRLLGGKVYYRGIVEFSNICTQNCLYCGIRRDNREVDRFFLGRAEILECTQWAAENGYGSCVLQSGERSDEEFVSFVEDSVKEIKARSRSSVLPDGLGITLSLGNQTQEVYRRWHDAGAHRYLLRIETSSPRLFGMLHPPEQKFEDRLRSLADLRECGFQVGTGVMIGIPEQTLEDLADDIIFFAGNDIDMIGMGPYIVSSHSAMRDSGMMESGALLGLALRMIAVVRLALKDVNIAATTALQALVENGRELGVLYGANVVMPNLTPQRVRSNYQLYEGKPCVSEGKQDCLLCLKRRIESAGRVVGFNEWGDSRHFKARAT